MPEPLFRPARKDDCRTIALLYSVSSDGVADYIWKSLAAPGEDPVEVGRKRYEREDSVFSYRNCTIVELDGRIVGMLVAFPLRVEPRRDEPDPVLRPYSVLEEDNRYYICGIAVFEAYRNRGIGRQLLELAEARAKVAGYRKLSLVAFEQNEGAVRLYHRSGYVESRRERVVSNPLIHYTGDALLMAKTI